MEWEAAAARHPSVFALGLGVIVTAITVALMALLPFEVNMSLALTPGAVLALVAYAKWLPSTRGANAHLAKVALVLGVVVLTATCILLQP